MATELIGFYTYSKNVFVGDLWEGGYLFLPIHTQCLVIIKELKQFLLSMNGRQLPDSQSTADREIVVRVAIGSTIELPGIYIVPLVQPTVQRNMFIVA